MDRPPPFVRVPTGFISFQPLEVRNPLPLECRNYEDIPSARPSLLLKVCLLHIVCLHVAKNGSSGKRHLWFAGLLARRGFS